jgi:hypothetical protein
VSVCAVALLYRTYGPYQILKRRSSNAFVGGIAGDPQVPLWAQVREVEERVGRNRAPRPTLSAFKNNRFYLVQADGYLAFGWHEIDIARSSYVRQVRSDKGAAAVLSQLAG